VEKIMKFFSQKYMKQIATLGPIGYLPAPGTMGTLAALPFVYFISLLSLPHQACIILVTSIVSLFIIDKALKSFNNVDPSQIVVDEFVGCLVTFAGIQFDLSSVLAGFLLFRLFDILKPLGIKKIEKLPGAWGVLLDDYAAGTLASILLWCLMR